MRHPSLLCRIGDGVGVYRNLPLVSDDNLFICTGQPTHFVQLDLGRGSVFGRYRYALHRVKCRVCTIYDSVRKRVIF